MYIVVVDFDECTVSSSCECDSQAVQGGCSPTCTNTPGSFSCSCPDSFNMTVENPNTCTGM